MIQAHYCIAMACRDPVPAPPAGSGASEAMASLRRVGFLSLDTVAKLIELDAVRTAAHAAFRVPRRVNAD